MGPSRGLAGRPGPFQGGGNIPLRRLHLRGTGPDAPFPGPPLGGGQKNGRSLGPGGFVDGGPVFGALSRGASGARPLPKACPEGMGGTGPGRGVGGRFFYGTGTTKPWASAGGFGPGGPG